MYYSHNESIAGADASVKLPKLKLLIAFIYTHYIMMSIFALSCMHTQRVGNDRPWLLLKTIDAKSSSLKLMAYQQSLAALFLLLQLLIAIVLVQSKY